jgi:hypothetical protein
VLAVTRAAAMPTFISVRTGRLAEWWSIQLLLHCREVPALAVSANEERTQALPRGRGSRKHE